MCFMPNANLGLYDMVACKNMGDVTPRFEATLNPKPRSLQPDGGVRYGGGYDMLACKVWWRVR